MDNRGIRGAIVNFLQGMSGKNSMMRVCTFVVVIGIMGIWAAHNIVAMKHGQGWVTMGVQELGLLVGCLGLKAAQRLVEGNGNGNGKKEVTNGVSTHTE